MTLNPARQEKACYIGPQGVSIHQIIPPKVQVHGALGVDETSAHYSNWHFGPALKPKTGTSATQTIANEVEDHEGRVLLISVEPTGFEYINLDSTTPGARYDGESRLLTVNPSQRFANKDVAYDKLPPSLREQFAAERIPIRTYTSGASYRDLPVADIATIIVKSCSTHEPRHKDCSYICYG